MGLTRNEFGFDGRDWEDTLTTVAATRAVRAAAPIARWDAPQRGNASDAAPTLTPPAPFDPPAWQGPSSRGPQPADLNPPDGGKKGPDGANPPEALDPGGEHVLLVDAGEDRTGAAAESIGFSFGFLDTWYDGPWHGIIDWGDDTTDEVDLPTIDEFGGSHLWESSGVYTVTVTVSCAGGNSDSDELQVIVASVEKVEWIDMDSYMDTNPNAGGGKRISPDKPLPDPDDFTNYRRVKVRATLDQPVPNIDVRFAWFDVDDPSSNEGPVDYEYIFVTNPPQEKPDNRLPDTAGLSSAAASSQLVDGKAIAELIFQVSMQPGNNYKVVASTSAPTLNGLRAKQDDGILARVIDANNNYLPTQHVKITELLTVWRRLHVEVDSMGAVAGQTAPQKGAEPNDDFLDNGEDVPMPDMGMLEFAMAEAYVKVFYDVGDNNNAVTFDLNVEANEPGGIIQSNWTSRLLNSPSFWVTYVLGAFQGPDLLDGDPDGQYTLMGFAPYAGGSLIYLESIRDWVRNWNRSAALPDQIGSVAKEQDTVVHEVGHAVGMPDVHPVTGFNGVYMEPPVRPPAIPHNDPSRYVPSYLDAIRRCIRPFNSY